MRPRPVPKLVVLGALLFVAAALGAAPCQASISAVAHPEERGFPLVQTYVPTPEGANPQNFGIGRDPRGLIYVGNLGGLLIYDGAWWRLLPIGKGATAFSVASDAAGRIAVGGVDELGYLATGPAGEPRFVSLLPLLPPGERRVGQVAKVHAVPGGFLFLAARRIYRWDLHRLTAVATYSDERPRAVTFAVRDAIYLWERRGIFRIDGQLLVPVPGGEAFRNRRVDAILAADPPGGLLVSVRGEGLFKLTGGAVTSFAPEASRWTAQKRLIESLTLPDGRWALGSVLGGLMLLWPNGTVDQVIDSSVGLPGDFVGGLVVDREGALWAALNNSLAKIEVASALSVIDGRSGLKGSVYCLARHQGRLWVGTEAGVFTTAASPGPPGGQLLQMEKLNGTAPAGWSLLSAGEDLLAGTSFGLYVVRPAAAGFQPQLVAGTDQRTVFVLVPSAADPNRVWMGTDEGLGSVRREGSTWRFEGLVPGVQGEVRSIVERTSGETPQVWLAIEREGIRRVDLLPAGRTRLLPAIPGTEGSYLFKIRDRLLAPRDEEIQRVDETRNAVLPDAEFAHVGRGDRSFLAEDSLGRLWMNTAPPSFVTPGETGGPAVVRTLVEVAARSLEKIVTEPDSVVWMLGENGLYRYVGSAESTAVPLPAPRVSRITTGDGRVIFGGAPGALPPAAGLESRVRHLRIELAALSARAGLRYQTRLEPEDGEWSPASPEPFAELTRLPYGDYVFHVRTVGPSGETSPETRWPFHVRAPWYGQGWALALWALLALGVVWGYAWLRSRTLRQRAAQLESRVAEQTVELRQRVEELRRAHSELEAANAQLEELTLQDDLTGVANRRCLQQTLATEWNRALWHRQSIALILLDLDDFKLLNDSRGHPEGDLCLQAVARYLAAAVRRAGDLVARYGGEEFAVLLPNADLSTAWQWADELRAGIEDLAFPHPASPRRVVTASLGIAAFVPAPGQRQETLVETADLALYRAKTSGKNRVSAGGRTGEIAIVKR